MSFATARQRYLLRQGYVYQVVKFHDLKGLADEHTRVPLQFATQRLQDQLLATVLEHKLNVSTIIHSSSSSSSLLAVALPRSRCLCCTCGTVYFGIDVWLSVCSAAVVP